MQIPGVSRQGSGDCTCCSRLLAAAHHATGQTVANGLHVTFAVALALIIAASTFAWRRHSAVNGQQNTR